MKRPAHASRNAASRRRLRASSSGAGAAASAGPSNTSGRYVDRLGGSFQQLRLALLRQHRRAYQRQWNQLGEDRPRQTYKSWLWTQVRHTYNSMSVSQREAMLQQARQTAMPPLPAADTVATRLAKALGASAIRHLRQPQEFTSLLQSMGNPRGLQPVPLLERCR